MEEVNIELVQFFREQARTYDFLLHRTRKEEDAVSIMNNGLYFENTLSKVTDSIREITPLSFLGNKLFFEAYGPYIIIIAIPKTLRGKYQEIVSPVEREKLTHVARHLDFVDCDDVYHLSSQYIMAFNVSFGRKLKFNRHFFEMSYQGAA